MKAGLSAVVSLVVGEDDTAIAMHSGTVPVLATPRVVALVEEAAVCAIADALEPGQTTVGMQVLLDHVQPSAIGRTVDAEATVKECNGRRIVFTVSVKDERGLVAAGKVTRVAVDIDRFLDKA